MALVSGAPQGFEDGATSLSFNPAQFTIQAAGGRLGPGRLEHIGGNAHRNAADEASLVTPLSGTPVIYEGWVRLDAGPAPTLCGLALSVAAGSNLGYQFLIDDRDGSGGSAAFQIRKDAGTAPLATGTGYAHAYGAWVRIVVTWAALGDLTAEFYDASGALLSTLTTTDATYDALYPGVNGYAATSFDDLQVRVEDGAVWSDVEARNPWSGVEANWNALPDKAAAPSVLSTAAAFPAPAVSTGSRAFPATRSTSTTVQNPSRSGVEAGVTHATAATFPAARLSMVEPPATHPTAAAVNAPALTMRELAPTHTTTATLPAPGFQRTDTALPVTLVTGRHRPQTPLLPLDVVLQGTPADGGYRVTSQSTTVFSTERFEINPDAPVVLEHAVEWRGDPGVGQRHYVGTASIDDDGFTVQNNHINRVSGSALAVLTAPLAPGDTTVAVSSAEGWHNGTTAHARSLALWPYVGVGGRRYEEGYTRNVALDSTNGTWPAGGISGNTITLTVPWALANPNAEDGVWPVGTPVANHQSGGTYNYTLLSNPEISDDTWQSAGPVQLGPPIPGPARTDSVWPGTRYVRFLILANRNVAGGATIYRPTMSVAAPDVPRVSSTENAPTHPTAAAFGAPALSTGWTAAAVTRATTAAVQVARLSMVARPATLARAAAFGSPALAGVARPGVLATAPAFGTPAITTTARVPAARHQTFAAVIAPTPSASSTPTPVTLARTAAFGGPAVVAQSRYPGPTHPTTATVGALVLSTGSTPPPATDTTTTAFGAPVLSVGASATPASRSTAAAFGAPALSTGWTQVATTLATAAAVNMPAASSRAFPASLSTATALGAPAPSSGSRATPAGLPTAATFGAPAPSTSWTQPVATVATASAVGTARLAAVEYGATIPTATAFGAPSLSLGARPVPASRATTAGFGSPSLSTGATPTPATLATAATAHDAATATDWTHDAATLGTTAAVEGPLPRTGATPTPAARATTSAFGASFVSVGQQITSTTCGTTATVVSPALYGAANADVLGTTSTVNDPRIASRARPGRRTTTSAFPAPAVRIDDLAAVAAWNTSANLDGAEISASATATPEPLASAAAVGAPHLAAREDATTHATAAAFGAPDFSTGMRLAQATHETTFASETPTARFDNTAWGMEHATAARFPNVSTGGVAFAETFTHETGAGFDAPELRISSIIGVGSRSTAAAFGAVRLEVEVRLAATRLATIAAFPPPSLNARENAATHPTAAAVQAPEVRTTALVRPINPPLVTYSAFPPGFTLYVEVRLDVARFATAAAFPPVAVRRTARPTPARLATAAAFGQPDISVVASTVTLSTSAVVRVPVLSLGADVDSVQTVATVSAFGDVTVILFTPPELLLDAVGMTPLRAAAAYAVDLAVEAAWREQVRMRASLAPDLACDADTDPRPPLHARAASTVPVHSG